MKSLLRKSAAWTLFVLVLVAGAARAEEDKPEDKQLPYVQHHNIVFTDTDDGIGLVMDIFVPTGKKNGLAIVDVVSGAWSSARGRLNDHKQAQMFDIICDRGYTVFAIRPGSVSKFTGLEMLENLKTGIRWVKHHADEYGIDPNRLGICGASAGGHLASLAVVTAEDAQPESKDPLKRYDTRLAAAAVFFPPTDFLNWGGLQADEKKTSPVVLMMGNLVFPGGTRGKKPEQINKGLEKISPARLITGKEPPMLFIHGDADPLVPLQQSELMVEALKKAGCSAELIVKAGGAHPWPTIHEEVAIAADWLDKQLGAARSDAETKPQEEPAKKKAA